MVKSNKGNIVDLFTFMIAAFILAITVVILFYAGTTAESELRDNVDVLQRAVGDGANATVILNDTFGEVTNANESLKWITTMLIVGMFLSILVTAYLTRTRPVFFVPYILLWIIAIIVSVPLSNVYEEVYLHPELVESFSGFWGQTYIFLNLPIWVIVIGGMAGLIMFINMVRQSQHGGFA